MISMPSRQSNRKCLVNEFQSRNDFENPQEGVKSYVNLIN